MDLARVFDGKKFMWDGRSYDDEQEMNRINQEYLSRGFEVQSLEEEGKYYLFSRRVVKEVIVNGSPI